MRKDIETTGKKKDLGYLVDLYGQNKDQESVLKKEIAKQNLSIKELLKNGTMAQADGKYSFSGEQYTATLSIEDSSTMNEEKLIAFLKQKISKTKLKTLGLIKTKEVVDESAVEAAIYAGEITPEMVAEMDSCKDASTKEVLRISKKKG